MAITASTKATFKKELIPSGSHVARCYSMVHIGTETFEYLGEKKSSNKVRLTFEIPGEKRVFKEENGEQPMSISKEYTLSLHEKSNLRKDLETWRGKKFTEKELSSFDVTNLIGVECMLSIVHSSNNGKEYANINGISRVPKGLECEKQINDSFEFNFDSCFDKFDSLPDFLKDKIKATPEYTKATEGVVDIKLDDDGLPF